ncbi:hypothetical protein F5Y15DRAFT_48243 [Xylariaceae sp. FL0016]|nr:hypothetical protein F5Y15DRAFT_48243 [Xylariaceae sp. FL0016]
MPASITKQILAAASWSSSRVDIIAIGSDNAMYHKGWDGSWQSDWDSLGGSFTSVAPTMVAWGPNRLDTFGLDSSSSTMMHNSWDGQSWESTWKPCPHRLSLDPSLSPLGRSKDWTFSAGEKTTTQCITNIGIHPAGAPAGRTTAANGMRKCLQSREAASALIYSPLARMAASIT